MQGGVRLQALLLHFFVGHGVDLCQLAFLCHGADDGLGQELNAAVAGDSDTPNGRAGVLRLLACRWLLRQ